MLFTQFSLHHPLNKRTALHLTLAGEIPTLPATVTRSHPKNPWIRNAAPARLLIFLSRHRIPFLSRLYMLFLGCDIAVALPRSVFSSSIEPR